MARVYRCHSRRWNRRAKTLSVSVALGLGILALVLGSVWILGLIVLGACLLWLSIPTSFQFGSDALLLYAGLRTIRIKYEQIRPFLSLERGAEDLTFRYQKKNGKTAQINLQANFCVFCYQAGAVSEVEFYGYSKNDAGLAHPKKKRKRFERSLLIPLPRSFWLSPGSTHKKRFKMPLFPYSR